MMKCPRLEVQGGNRMCPPNATNDSSRSLSKLTPDALIETVVMAIEGVGDPSHRGKGGAAGYYKWFATKNPRAFLMPFLHALQLLPPQPTYGEITEENAFIEKLARIASAAVRRAGLGQNARPDGDARPQRDADLEGESVPCKKDPDDLIVG